MSTTRSPVGRDLPSTPAATPPPPRRAPIAVAVVARRLGVAPSTLRTWDRRYNLGPSERVAGAHRRYTDADVARLLIMRRLTLEGVAPADAAAIAGSASVSDDALRKPALPTALVRARAVRARPGDEPETVLIGAALATMRHRRERSADQHRLGLVTGPRQDGARSAQGGGQRRLAQGVVRHAHRARDRRGISGSDTLEGQPPHDQESRHIRVGVA